MRYYPHPWRSSAADQIVQTIQQGQDDDLTVVICDYQAEA
jgi:hypothetical protein